MYEDDRGDTDWRDVTNHRGSVMRVLAKTFGWLLVSGVIIFTSNLFSGVDWKTSLYGAVVAKIGTTVAYFVYEVAFEKGWKKG